MGAKGKTTIVFGHVSSTEAEVGVARVDTEELVAASVEFVKKTYLQRNTGEDVSGGPTGAKP